MRDQKVAQRNKRWQEMAYGNNTFHEQMSSSPEMGKFKQKRLENWPCPRNAFAQNLARGNQLGPGHSNTPL